MIRVIFYDGNDYEMWVVEKNREELKHDPKIRSDFACEVNHTIAKVLSKLRDERKEEEENEGR